MSCFCGYNVYGKFSARISCFFENNVYRKFSARMICFCGNNMYRKCSVIMKSIYERKLYVFSTRGFWSKFSTKLKCSKILCELGSQVRELYAPLYARVHFKFKFVKFITFFSPHYVRGQKESF